MERILALTVVVELPHDLGISNRAVFAFEKGEPWPGWDAPSMAVFAGYPPETDEARRPAFRLAFERTRVRGRVPRQAAERAFGRWIMPLLPIRRKLRRRIGLRLAGVRGLRQTVSVAAITAFIPARTEPNDPFAGWYEEQIARAIQVLNEFLVSLGAIAGDARVGPVSRSELPAVVPLIAEYGAARSWNREGSSWLVPIHPWVSGSENELDPGVLRDAAALFRGAVEGATAWFPVLELAHLGLKDGLAGRYGPSIVNAATSIEILLSTLVRTAGPIRGLSHEEVDAVLSSGLKNLLSTHVSRLLATKVELTDESSVWGRWWASGYLVRNRVVHEGYRSNEAEADEATNAALHVVAEVGRLIKADEELRHLGFGLPDSVSVGEDWIARTEHDLPTTPGR